MERVRITNDGLSADARSVERQRAFGNTHGQGKRSQEFCAKMSAALKGKPKSAEHRAAISESRKRLFASRRSEAEIAAAGGACG
jgi:hypothetical protein